MSISNVTDIVGPFAISTLPQTLSVSYPFQNAADLIVYDTGTSGAPVYPATILTLNSDYSVTGGGYDTAGNMQPGSIQVVSGGANNVQVGHNIVIARRPPLTQLTSFLLTGFLTAEMIEQALDKLTTITQALQDGVNRSLRVTDVDAVVSAMTKGDRAGKIPAFDASGNLVFVDPSAVIGETVVLGTTGEVTVVTDPVTNTATVSLPAALIFTGKTVTGGTLKSVVSIGIGTATPLYQIDVNDPTSAAIRVFKTGAGGKAILLASALDRTFLNSDGVIEIQAEELTVGQFDSTGWNGNAATATKLKTARTINGVAFDGSANISIAVGSGDVVGPAGATDGHVALFDGATGKLIKGGGALGSAAFASTSAFDAAGAAAAAQSAAIAAAASDATTKANNAQSAAIAAAASDATTKANNAQAAAISAAATDATTKANAAQAAAIAASCQRSRNAINVKDYGAVGDGSTNDTAAIVSAIAALPSSNAALYFPYGTYVTDTISITSKLGLTIFGDGYGSSKLKARTASRVLILNSTNSYVSVRNLSFNGNCTTRTAGQQAVTLDCSYSQFNFNEILNSGEYALMWGRNTAVSNIQAIGNYIHDTYADGINLYQVTHGLISSNLIAGADDDLIAVGASTDVLIVGNNGKSRNDLGTSWGRGIAILAGCTDITVDGCNITGVKQYGLYIAAEGGTVPTDIRVKGSTFHDCAILSGSNGYIYDTKRVTVEGCNFDNPVTGNCLDIGKWNYLDIKGGRIQQWRNQFCRGIHADETVLGGAQNWLNLSISGTTINLTGVGNAEGIYLHPDATHVTMTNVAVYNVLGVCAGAGAANYIDMDASIVANLGRIVNNLSLNGNTINPATTTGVVLVANNN